METIMQYIPLAVSAIPAGGTDPDRNHQHHHPGGEENHLEQDPHQYSGGGGGHGCHPGGVLCGVPDHGWAVTWYMVAGAVALGLFVAYAAMFDLIKLRRPLSYDRTGTKTKRSRDPRHRRCWGILY